MATTYKMNVKLDWHDVQSLCMKHNWYTRGTSAEFLTLQQAVWELDSLNGHSSLWLCKLQRIAEDIKDHSETDYEVADIMTALNCKCRTWFDAE